MAETMAAVAPKYGAAAATTATGTLQTASVVSPTISPPTISPPIGVDVGSVKKESLEVDEELDDLEDYKEVLMGGGEETGWKPVHWICTWRDRLYRERYTVVLLLPSGIGSGMQFTVRVAEDCRNLEVCIDWPPLLYMVTNMVGSVARNSICEAKATAMGMQVCEMKKKLKSGKPFNSSCRIKMPREIESTAEMMPIGTHDGTRILMIDLVIKGEYGGMVDSGKFLMLPGKMKGM